MGRSLCDSCNNEEGYYPKLKDISKGEQYIDCFNDSINYYYLDKNDYLFKDCYSTCKKCYGPGVYKNNNCSSCIENYILRNDFENDTNCYQNCEAEGKNYFFDEFRNFSCVEKCPKNYRNLIESKNKCIDNCSKDDTFKYEFRKKCLKECPQSPYKTHDYYFYCQIECPKEKPFEMVEEQECYYRCEKNIYRAEHLCVLNNRESNITYQDEQDFVDSYKQLLSDGKLDNEINKIVESGNESIIQDKRGNYTLSNTVIQKNNENYNVTAINLGECEDKLRQYYFIDKEIPLLVFKIDIFEEGWDLPKIEYEVYNPYNRDQLNLNLCQNSKIKISLPINMNKKDIDRRNSSSGFYHDICYTYTSDKGTDVTLEDRKKEFIKNNLTVCEENCNFTGYDEINQKAFCSCSVKVKLPFMWEIKFDRQRFYNNFLNLKDIVNLKIMKCYHVLFTKEGFENNIGCYIIVPIILMHIACTVIFYKNEYKKIIYKIKAIVYIKKNFEKIKEIKKQREEQAKKLEKEELKLKENNSKKNEEIKDESKNESIVQPKIEPKVEPIIEPKNENLNEQKKEFDDFSDESLQQQSCEKKDKELIEDDTVDKKENPFHLEDMEEKEQSEKKIKSNDITGQEVNESSEKKEKSENENSSFNIFQLGQKNSRNKSINHHPPPIKKVNLVKNNYIKDYSINNLRTNDSNSIRRLNFQNSVMGRKDEITEKDKTKKNEGKTIKIDLRIMKYTDYELNILSYEDALKEDKRNYFQYYFSLLKTRHLFMFSFIKNEDFNSRIIKIDLFLIYFTISYTTAAFFFNDDTMHQIYVDEGEFNFIYQIPKIIYSFLISSFLNFILNSLSLSQNNIIEIKQFNNLDFLDKKAGKTVKILNLKFLIFFVISFPFLFFCWYYLGCFCAVYKNTQIHLIKDAIISLLLTFLYPIFLYILPGLFRIPSLRSKKQNSVTMYKFSKIFQLI